MNVNFEFLDVEPVENIITCLHYQFDKVVFFGYQKVIEANRQRLTAFLKQECNVSEVEFQVLSEKDLPKILTTMEVVISQEKAKGNHIFFDITGGEDVVLVAFGMLCAKYHFPLHMFQVEKNKMRILAETEEYAIDRDVPSQDIKLTIENIILLRGGIIKYGIGKKEKSVDGDVIGNTLEKIWNLSRELGADWTKYSAMLARFFNPGAGICDVHLRLDEIDDVVDTTPVLNGSKNTLNSFLDRLAADGLICCFSRLGLSYDFTYLNEEIKMILITAGDVLEIHTGLEIADRCDDYMVGVHLDWDGIILEPAKQPMDVYNEIDVLAIKDNILTFISCKDGQLNVKATDEELYKLDTVTKRFGGKYYKATLVATCGIPETRTNRAHEMGISVVNEL